MPVFAIPMQAARSACPLAIYIVLIVSRLVSTILAMRMSRGIAAANPMIPVLMICHFQPE
jgi:hypothetical protein